MQQGAHLQDSRSEGRLSPAARAELITRYVPLIRKVANQLAMRLPPSVEYDDLVSSGVLGLISAIDRYDPTKGTNFKSYAEIRIRGAILDELRSLDWVPRSVRQRVSKLHAVYGRLEQELGRKPTDKEVAGRLGLPLGEFYALLNRSHPMSIVSFEDLGIGGDQEQRDFLDCLKDESAVDPHVKLKLNRVRAALTHAIEQLPDRQRTVLSLYYFEDLNLREIGKILGVTESRISQIHTQAINNLRKSLKRSLLN